MEIVRGETVEDVVVELESHYYTASKLCDNIYVVSTYLLRSFNIAI